MSKQLYLQYISKLNQMWQNVWIDKIKGKQVSLLFTKSYLTVAGTVRQITKYSERIRQPGNQSELIEQNEIGHTYFTCYN